MSLRTRVIVLVLGVATLTTLLTAWLVSRTAEDALRAEQASTLEDRAAIYQALADYGSTHRTWDDVDDLVEDLSREYDVRVALVDDGSVVADSGTADAEDLPEGATWLDPLLPAVSFTGETAGAGSAEWGEPLEISSVGAVRRCLREAGFTPTGGAGSTQTRETGAEADAARRECEVGKMRANSAPPLQLRVGAGADLGGPLGIAGTRSLLIAALILAASGLVGWWLSRRLTRPLTELADTAEHLAAGDLARRSTSTGPDEVGRVGVAFNAMASSLEASADQRSRLVSDVAHELGNPLVTIGGTLEALQDGIRHPSPEVIASMTEEVDHLGALVRDLADLSRVEAGGLLLEPAEVDLGALARSVLSAVEASAPEVALRCSGSAAAWCDARRTRQIVSNLVTNAVHHTPPGGAVDVEVGSAAGRAWLTVADAGPGIATADLPHVFERFWRADASRSRATGGSGLGLAICRELARAQGGDVTVASTVGAGTTFGLTLPVDP